MPKSKELVIEIGRMKRTLDAEDYSVIEVLGLVSSKPGIYTIQSEITVRVCPVVSRYRQPSLQKIILQENGNRRTITFHHNAVEPVVQDLNSQESLIFKRCFQRLIRQEGSL